MDKIYPEKQLVSAPLILSRDEELSIKKAIVIARQKEIIHPQDRALYAVAEAGISLERQGEIKKQLQTVIDLEPSIIGEGAALAAAVEKAYEDGKTDVVSLAPVIDSQLVDAVIYAKRFVDVKEDRPITPIFEEKEVVPTDPEPIIEDGGEIAKP